VEQFRCHLHQGTTPVVVVGNHLLGWSSLVDNFIPGCTKLGVTGHLRMWQHSGGIFQAQVSLKGTLEGSKGRGRLGQANFEQALNTYK
jgi:hypothetical protein